MGLDDVELIMMMESHFGITIDPDEAGAARTVGKLEALIISKKFQSATPEERESVHAWMIETLVNDFGVRERDIRPDARIYEDLGFG